MNLQPHPLNTEFKWQDAELPFSIISTEQAEQGNREGYFLLEGVLTLEALQAVKTAIDPMEEKTSEFLRTVKDRRQFIARADELTFAPHPVLRSTDATIENGCPWVMPGVHSKGTLDHWYTDLGWQCLDGLDGAVPVEAKTGDVVVFSSLTPHRTALNNTAEERKAYIVQYCHDGSRMYPREGEQGVTQNHPERQFLMVKDDAPV